MLISSLVSILKTHEINTKDLERSRVLGRENSWSDEAGRIVGREKEVRSLSRKSAGYREE